MQLPIQRLALTSLSGSEHTNIQSNESKIYYQFTKNEMNIKCTAEIRMFVRCQLSTFKDLRQEIKVHRIVTRVNVGKAQANAEHSLDMPLIYSPIKWVLHMVHIILSQIFYIFSYIAYVVLGFTSGYDKMYFTGHTFSDLQLCNHRFQFQNTALLTLHAMPGTLHESNILQ